MCAQITPVRRGVGGHLSDEVCRALGGSAYGYQELFAALAIPTTTGQAGGEPYIYTLLHLVRTPAFAANRVFRIAVVLASSSVVPAARGPSPLAAKLVAGHGAGDEREPRPGRPDAAGARGGVPGWPGCRPGAWRPRAIRGRGTDASPGSSSGARPRNVAVEPACAVQVAGAPEDAAARSVRIPVPASRQVTPVVKENARRAAVRYWNGPFGPACWRSADRFDLREADPIADTAVSHAGSALCGASSVVSSVRVPAGPTGEPRGRRRCNSWP